MSSQLNSNQIAQILAQAQEQGIDLSNPQAISAFSNNLVAKPAKVKRDYQIPADESRCLARVWGKGTGLDQCSKSRNQKDGECDYCTLHQKEANQSVTPCQYDEQGNKFGLFCGRIDEDIPYLNADGLIAIRWNNDAIKSAIASLEGTAVNSKAALYTNEWYTFNKTKRIPTVKRVRKAPKAVKVAVEVAAPKSKGNGKKAGKKAKDPNAPVRATNAYMCWLAQSRADIKANVLQEFIANNPESTPEQQKAAVSIGKVGAAAGSIWKTMSDEDKAPWKALEEKDKARYARELEAYKSGKALEQIVTEEEPAVAEEEGSGELECEEITVDNTDYLYDAKTGQLYTIDCDPCGFLVDGKVVQEK